MSLRDDLRSTPVKLALTLVAGLLLALAVLGLWISRDVADTLAARTRAAVAHDAARVEALARAQGIDAVVAALDTRALADNLYLLTVAGRVRAASFKVSTAPPAHGGVFRYTANNAPDTHLAFGFTLDLGPGVTLILARNIDDERALALSLQRKLLASIALLALAGLGGGVWLSRALDRRLARINSATAAIVAGDLSKRIATDSSNDEFDRLSGNLNGMLDRIDGLMQALREVSDNIAHDLKTPINRLRNTAEEALRAAPEKQSAALGAVIEQADGIIQTFNALLLIARLEHEAAGPPPDDVILADLVAGVADLYGPVAEDAKLTFALRLTNRTRVKVHRQLMVQAVANLVDNAIKYAGDPQRGYVETLSLTVVTMPKTVDIYVTDRGPGIPAAQHAAALKRFGRLDASRSLPGTGLGLSLVAAIARLHGGRLRLVSGDPGLRAIIEVPRAKSDET